MEYLEEKGNTLAPIGAMKQQIRNKTGFPYKKTDMDSTQKPINDTVFTKGTDRNAMRKMAGDHATMPTKSSHTNNKGWDTLSCDTRNQPLAGTDVSYGMLDANHKKSIRIVEAGSRMVKGKKNDPLGNVLSS